MTKNLYQYQVTFNFISYENIIKNCVQKNLNKKLKLKSIKLLLEVLIDISEFGTIKVQPPEQKLSSFNYLYKKCIC